MKFTPRLSPLNKKKMEQRDKQIAYLYNEIGLTGEEIARREGMTRERVHQIIEARSGSK